MYLWRKLDIFLVYVNIDKVVWYELMKEHKLWRQKYYVLCTDQVKLFIKNIKINRH